MSGSQLSNTTGLYTSKYAVLGDDVVIFDEGIAVLYQQFMAMIGVEINLVKSVVGEGVAEFAKSLFVRGDDVSPLPIEPLRLRRAYYIQDTVIILENLGKRGILVEYEDLIKAVGQENNTLQMHAVITSPCIPFGYSSAFSP